MNDSYLAYKCIHTFTCDRFTLYTSHPTRSMPFHKGYTHGCLGTFVKIHLAQHFGNQKRDTEEHTGKMSSRQGSAELEKGDSGNPKWGLLRITHAAHIYSTRGTGPNSGTADTAPEIEKRKTTEPKHPYTLTKDRTTARSSLPKAGWTCRLSRQPRWKHAWKDLFWGFPFQTPIKSSQSVQCAPGSGREYATTYGNAHLAADFLEGTPARGPWVLCMVGPNLSQYGCGRTPLRTGVSTC